MTAIDQSVTTSDGKKTLKIAWKIKEIRDAANNWSLAGNSGVSKLINKFDFNFK